MTSEEYVDSLKRKYGKNAYIYKQALKDIEEGKEMRVEVKEDGKIVCFIGRLDVDKFANSISQLY